MSIRDDKKENDLIYKTLLTEEVVDGDMEEDQAAAALGLDPTTASEGENKKQIGKTNGEEKDEKASSASTAILDMVGQRPLDQQASVWHAIVQDTNLAGRVIERWDHDLKKVLIQSLVEHGETDAFNNINPPRPVADEPKVQPHPGGGELDLGQ